MKPLVEEIQEIAGKRGYIVSDVDYTHGDRLVIGIKESKTPKETARDQLELEFYR